ncbi:MAG: NAD(P)-dependent oxidoreductase [Acidimicrobiales bacterium]|nr:NAD(P)-dependent oxidoreductase [Acidimicrobiales bacterium]
MSSRLLVTGATGLVGPSVVERLLADGHEVICIGRSPAKIEHENHLFVQADLSQNCAEVLGGLEDIVAIAHMAAHIGGGSPEEDAAAFQSVNIDLTRHLLDFARERKVRRFIHMSTFAFLARPLQLPITEGHPTSADEGYAHSKLVAEQMVCAAATGGLSTVALRIPSPLPPRFAALGPNVVRHWIASAAAGQSLKVFGDGGRRQDFLATSDVAAAVSAALSKAEPGVYNIASGQPLSMGQLARQIAEHFHVEIVFEGVEGAPERWDIDISKATRELGFEPRVAPRDAIAALLGSAT